MANYIWFNWNRGGVGVDVCAEMVNHKFARVFNKFLYSIRVTVLNLYMVKFGLENGV